MRVFVAVTPPPEVRRAALGAVEAAARELGSAVRWTKQENIHLTLKFLGEVPDETLGAVRDALREACSAHAPFDARLRGLGAFPTPRRARVVWAGVDEGAEEITALAASVESALKPLGFRREGRPYVPHATLGRARKRPVDIRLPEAGVPDAPGFRVGSAQLVRSTLAPGGSIYEVLEAFALGGAGGGATRGRGRSGAQRS